MIQVEEYQPTDLPTVTAFVEAIQEHERAMVPQLKPGRDIGDSYTADLLESVAARSGAILLARAGDETIGFACAWIETEDDPLLREEARAHAYVSDLYVVDAWRRQGVARLLMEALEAGMRRRGCRRIRVCSKAGNAMALDCYAAMGYRPYEVIFAKSLE